MGIESQCMYDFIEIKNIGPNISITQIKMEVQTLVFLDKQTIGKELYKSLYFLKDPVRQIS